MLDFNVRIFSHIYNSCKQMGSILGYGAFEGFIIYSSLISLGIIKFLDTKKVKK